MIEPISATTAVLKETVVETIKEALVEALLEGAESILKESPLSSSLETIESISLETLEAQNIENMELVSENFQSIEDMNISKEELSIYKTAGLEKMELNGREVLIQPNIDLNSEIGPFRETNLERMRNGYSPLDENGKQYQLHHIGQKMDSPLAELTHEQHCLNGNYKTLHSKEGISEINRKEFNFERSEHWKERARLIDEKYNYV